MPTACWLRCSPRTNDIAGVTRSNAGERERRSQRAPRWMTSTTSHLGATELEERRCPSCASQGTFASGGVKCSHCGRFDSVRLKAAGVMQIAISLNLTDNVAAFSRRNMDYYRTDVPPVAFPRTARLLPTRHPVNAACRRTQRPNPGADRFPCDLKRARRTPTRNPSCAAASVTRWSKPELGKP